MGRLRNLSSSVSALSPRIGRKSDASGHDIAAEPWRAWYWTARWRRLRLVVLSRDLYTCQHPGCGQIEADTSKLVVDHKRPHRGDEALFWDEDNLQTLCIPHHNRDKQREEHRRWPKS